MKYFFIALLWCWGAQVMANDDIPSEQERQATGASLSARRDAIEATYKQDLKDCYQKFDVNACRTQARERRLAADKALRPEELAHKAIERRVHTEEARQRLADKNSEAKQKEGEAQRAQALQERQRQASAVEQKQIDHALQGTQRGEYNQRQREAQEHRASVEKRLRERNKEPAAPLPTPAGASH